jgi:hypothetical protein
VPQDECTPHHIYAGICIDMSDLWTIPVTLKFKYNISNTAVEIELTIKLIEKRIKIQNITIFILYKDQFIVYINTIVDLQDARPSLNIQ